MHQLNSYKRYIVLVDENSLNKNDEIRLEISAIIQSVKKIREHLEVGLAAAKGYFDTVRESRWMLNNSDTSLRINEQYLMYVEDPLRNAIVLYKDKYYLVTARRHAVDYTVDTVTLLGLDGEELHIDPDSQENRKKFFVMAAGIPNTAVHFKNFADTLSFTKF